MDSQLIESQLIEYLQNERVEVTYKMLSRKCSITVNQAKKALEQFYNKVSLSKSSSLGLIPLYFLCKNSNEYYVGVKPDLGEAGIDSIKVLHAYALSPTTREAAKQRIIDGTIEDSLYLIDSQISRSDGADELFKYRSILHPTMAYSAERKTEKKNADIIPTVMSKSSSAPSIKSAVAKSSAAQSKMAKSNSASSKSFFSAKGKQQKEEKNPTQPKSFATKVSAEATKKPPSVLIIPEGAVLPFESPSVSPAKPLATPLPPASLKKEPVAISKESAAQASQIINMFEEDENMEDTKGDNVVIVAEEDQVTENEESNPATSVSPNRKVIKRRKVIKSETYTEGKYLKTRDVEVWEEYESDDANPLPKKRGITVGGGGAQLKAKSAATAPSAGSKTKGPKVQRSVASFFKRKE